VIAVSTEQWSCLAMTPMMFCWFFFVAQRFCVRMEVVVDDGR
jgi:hypothetical protein